jgi:excinuclease ABC subunit C
LGRSLDDLPAGSVSSEFTVGADTSGTSSGQQQNEMMAAMCEGVGEASLRLEELEELALVLDGGRDARRPPPRTIECYDVSHLYGSYTVAAASAATCGVLDLDRYGCYPLGPDSGVPPADDCAALRAALRLRFGGSGGIGGVAAAGTAVRVDGGVRAAKGVGAEMGVGTEAIVGAAATRVGAEGRVEAAAGVGAEGGLEAATAGSGVSWDAWDVPDLILIDGGKPQLGAAMAVLDEVSGQALPFGGRGGRRRSEQARSWAGG